MCIFTNGMVSQLKKFGAGKNTWAGEINTSSILEFIIKYIQLLRVLLMVLVENLLSNSPKQVLIYF